VHLVGFIIRIGTRFRRLCVYSRKALLVSTYLSHWTDFSEICGENPDLAITGQTYQAKYMNI